MTAQCGLGCGGASVRAQSLLVRARASIQGMYGTYGTYCSCPWFGPWTPPPGTSPSVTRAWSETRQTRSQTMSLRECKQPVHYLKAHGYLQVGLGVPKIWQQPGLPYFQPLLRSTHEPPSNSVKKKRGTSQSFDHLQGKGSASAHAPRRHRGERLVKDENFSTHSARGFGLF